MRLDPAPRSLPCANRNVAPPVPSNPKHLTWADVLVGDPYTALVHDDTGEVEQYRTAWTTWCYAGSDPGEPEAPDITPPDPRECADCEPPDLLAP